MRKSVLTAILFSSAALALACGGGDTSSFDIPEASTPSAGVSGAVGPGSLGSWTNPTDDISSALKAAGWSIEECSNYSSEGETYADCSASKGSQWADVDYMELKSEQDAKWSVEGTESATRDGKRVLEVTVYDGKSAESLGLEMLPKGGKISGVQASAVETVFKAKGWSIDESSSGTSDGQTYGEVLATKGGNMAFAEWGYAKGSSGGNEDRDPGDGIYSVYQGDGDSFNVAVLDEGSGKSLLQQLVK